jgi:S1-C subfamily serine protease
VISEIQTNGPAEQAGFEVGDVIVAVDDKPVKDAEDFLVNVYSHQVGAVLKCEVDRGGERLVVNYEVQERKGR